MMTSTINTVIIDSRDAEAQCECKILFRVTLRGAKGTITLPCTIMDPHYYNIINQ